MKNGKLNLPDLMTILNLTLARIEKARQGIAQVKGIDQLREKEAEIKQLRYELEGISKDILRVYYNE